MEHIIIQKQNMFIYYNGTIIKKQLKIIYCLIYWKKYRKKKDLQENKQQIKDMIGKIKNTYNTIPESITIQTIINYLYPVIFKTKAEAKYFLHSW